MMSFEGSDIVFGIIILAPFGVVFLVGLAAMDQVQHRGVGSRDRSPL